MDSPRKQSKRTSAGIPEKTTKDGSSSSDLMVNGADQGQKKQAMYLAQETGHFSLIK
jgi:hypothetical protein